MSLLDNDFDLSGKDLEVILINKIIQSSSLAFKDKINCNNIVYNPDSIKDIKKRDYKYYTMYIKHATYVKQVFKSFPSSTTMFEYKYIIEWHWYPHNDLYSYTVLVDGQLVNLNDYMKNR